MRGTSQKLFYDANSDVRGASLRARRHGTDILFMGETDLPPAKPARKDARRTPTSEGGCDTSQRPAKILEAVQTFFDYVDARGIAEPNGPVVTERGAGNDGDIRFA
jgi:hypothetical protein